MEKDRLLTDEEVAVRRKRLREAIHLQKMENNPLTSEEIENFEISLRERWSDEKCLSYVIERAKKRSDS
jgi:hypothetical protein